MLELVYQKLITTSKIYSSSASDFSSVVRVPHLSVVLVTLFLSPFFVTILSIFPRLTTSDYHSDIFTLFCLAGVILFFRHTNTICTTSYNDFSTIRNDAINVLLRWMLYVFDTDKSQHPVYQLTQC